MRNYNLLFLADILMLLSNNFVQILGGKLRINSQSENYCKKQILADGNNNPIVSRAHYCPGIFRQPIYFVIKKGKIRQLDTQIDAFYEQCDGEQSKENGNQCKVKELLGINTYQYSDWLPENDQSKNEQLQQEKSYRFTKYSPKRSTIHVTVTKEGKCFAMDKQKLYNCPNTVCHVNTFFFIANGILYDLTQYQDFVYKLLAKECWNETHQIVKVDSEMETANE